MKTGRHTFRYDDADRQRWDRAARLLRLNEFGDYVRRALDDLADRVLANEAAAPTPARRGDKRTTEPDPKKKG